MFEFPTKISMQRNTDDDDPVVQEIPIFNCSDMGSKSFIMQFPLISRKSTLPGVQIASHDTNKDTYHFIALPESDIFSSSEATKYLIETHKIVINQPYAVGILHENQLHLTPITQIHQARPSLQPNNNLDSIPGVPIDWMELENPNGFISSSHDDISSPMSATMFHSRITDTHSSMNPEMFENVPDAVISSRPPNEQLYLRMIKDKTIFFDDVVKQLNLKAYTFELLDSLLQYGYYVQGRWTIKPEKLPESILPRELRTPRAFMIVLFAHSKQLKIQLLPKFLQIFGITNESLKKILDGIGIKLNGGNLVAFKFKQRLTFEETYPEIAEKAKAEILKLKEAICMAKHDQHLFDEFLN
ncbi:DNA-directed RNA polymerase III subunit RPC5-like protein [Histomonas meleagridis]|uniref:DNA-directed RNA polymerase III subunit RPC5-like protein n=1 Tax=Histomonas meleagridis TaxID=135588 RepID=UPI00355AC5C0|nr:DNA-directed RNA polymerase III subunit RPC5-like protein [Histomonas meleagridis]KAH0802797.1 DNA-directed RNA polymerase III subunit RPC5-like protein [Histomonas meleagridis]